jgi:hypothetical protein
MEARIEALIALVDGALGDTPPVIARIGRTATALAQLDPEIAESAEAIIDACLIQARKRRIVNDPDVQAARRWARDMGRTARKGRA